MKNILVVGTDRGLGLALTHKFLDQNWKVTATIRKTDDATAIDELKNKFKDKLNILNVDITDTNSVRTLCEHIGESEVFDVIYMNAGIFGPVHQLSTEVTDEEVLQLFLTNTIGPVRLARRLMRNLKYDGTLCFMSSHRGSIDRNIEGGLELYRATKAGLNTMARGLFSEFSQKNITVLNIHPGWVDTAMGTLDGAVEAEITVEESIDGLYDVVIRNMGTKKNLFLDYKNMEWPW